MNSHGSKLYLPYSISFNLWKCSQNFLGLSAKEKFFCAVFTYSIKWVHEIWNHATATKKCTKKHDARAKFLFCYYKPVALLMFFLPSPSLLLKLHIVVIQKFCYHGNLTSHFSSLFLLGITVVSREIEDSVYANFGGVTKQEAL